VFQASQLLLSLADQIHAKTPLDPSPSTLRMMMATLHVRSGDLASARPMLEDVVRREPSLQGYSSLASVLFQAQDNVGALAALDKGLKAPDAKDSPLGRADAHLLAFEINRARGNADEARASLAAALNNALDARTQARSEMALTSAERLIARLSYHFGDHPAWVRAVGRMFRQAGADRHALSLALVETTSTALLYKDAKTARDALERTLDAADVDDLVYAALWLQLAEKAAGERGDDTAKQALESIPESAAWAYQLAKWGLGQMTDQELTTKARTLVEKTEAAFYIAMRQRTQGDPAARTEIARVATGPAIDLVETHLARELTLSDAQQTWGPPPRALP
jgi:tetratricopeptide (TPR) repeat protein